LFKIRIGRDDNEQWLRWFLDEVSAGMFYCLAYMLYTGYIFTTCRSVLENFYLTFCGPLKHVIKYTVLFQTVLTQSPNNSQPVVTFLRLYIWLMCMITILIINFHSISNIVNFMLDFLRHHLKTEERMLLNCSLCL